LSPWRLTTLVVWRYGQKTRFGFWVMKATEGKLKSCAMCLEIHPSKDSWP